MSPRRSLLRLMQKNYYRMMMPYWQSQFSPYIGDVKIGQISFRFYYGTPLSKDWYDPIKTYALTEYLWVLDNYDFVGQNVLDVGAHHGHYSTFFAAMGCCVTAVEPLPGNVALLEVNAALNRFDIDIVQAAISDQEGSVTFLPRSNGKLFPDIGITVSTRRLPEINTEPVAVKLDIEGAEFRILPHSIDEIPSVNIWIIEVHHRAGSIAGLAREFMQRGFSVSYVDRQLNKVLPFQANGAPQYTTTVFCVK